MIKNAIAEDDCALRNPRRNQYRRNTHPQAVKLKTKHRIGRKFIRGASGWRHVVVNSTMLVVNNQQRTALPELLIGSDRLVHRLDEALAHMHATISVLVGFIGHAILDFMILVVWFTNRIVLQFDGFGRVKK